MREYRSLVFLLCVALLSGAACAAELNETDRLQFADGLYARGMYDVAVKEYLGFLDRYPASESADVAYFRLGECYRALQKIPEADKAFRTLFNNHPDSEYRLKAGCKRADLYIETGQYDAALDLFDLVLAQNPGPEIASACLFFKGEAFLKSGRDEMAASELERVVRDHPESRYFAYALLKLGSIRAKDNAKTDEALKLFVKASESAKTDRIRAEALFQIADLHFRRKSYEKSAEYYRKLLTGYPSDERAIEAALQAAWAAYHAGFYAESLGRTAEAVAGITDTAGKPAAEAHAEWLYLKANCERQLMKNSEAASTYAELIEKYPDSMFAGGARYEKAVAFYKMGEYQEAIDEASGLETEGDLRRDVYWLLAESYAALEKDEEAIQFYRLLTRNYPESDVACDAGYRLAHHLQSTGNNKEAVRQYHVVAEKFPDSELAPQALFAAALCLLRDSFDAEAARDLETLIDRYPKCDLVERSLYHRAMCEIRLKRSDEALVSLRELLKQFPGTGFAADSRYWIGMLLMESEKLEDAEAAFMASLRLSPREELARNAEFHLGVVLYRQGRKDEALERFIPLISSPARERFSPELLVWISESLLEKRKYEQSSGAAHLLLDSASNENQRQAGWGLLARSESARGNKAVALDAFRKCLECDANTRFAGEAALRLGEIALESEDFAKAEQYFSRAAALAGDESALGVRAGAYAGLARTSKARNDLESASRYFMSVAVLYDDPVLVPACLMGAAEAFTTLGRDEAAERTLAELMDRYPESKEAQQAAREKKTGQ